MVSAMQNKWKLGILGLGILTAVSAIPTTAFSQTLVVPGAPLTLGGDTDDRIHPCLAAPPIWSRFNIYTGGALDLNGWTSVASQSPDFNDGADELKGVFHSEVWRKENHLLFAYMIENTGMRAIHTGDMEACGGQIGVADCGVLHVDGDDAYAQYDVLQLGRALGASGPQLRFYFEAVGDDRMLPAGESSTWFYIETDVNDWASSFGTVKNSGIEANIDVLVPTPEPATAGLVAVGFAVAMLRQRRRSRMS